MVVLMLGPILLSLGFLVAGAGCIGGLAGAMMAFPDIDVRDLAIDGAESVLEKKQIGIADDVRKDQQQGHRHNCAL